jgi:hypothetical protein
MAAQVVADEMVAREVPALADKALMEAQVAHLAEVAEVQVPLVQMALVVQTLLVALVALVQHLPLQVLL